jgi:hypothetical protein
MTELKRTMTEIGRTWFVHPGPGSANNVVVCARSGRTAMSDRVFRDRRDAGRVLAGLLDHYRGQPDVVVLGLPRGGVPVAYEVAMALGAPLDVFLVRKLGVPGREEPARTRAAQLRARRSS